MPSSNYESILFRLIKPIVRFAVSHSILFQDVIPILKAAFLEVAEDELLKHSNKINASRLSLVTGIHRSEIRRKRWKEHPAEKREEGMLGRVIGQWEQDKNFRNKTGEPRILSCDGEGSEFFKLVYLVSKNFNPATVLFEIQRNGAALMSGKGIKLVRSHAILADQAQRAYEILAKDCESLGLAVEENVRELDKLGHLHIRTEYDNIYLRYLPEIRRRLVDEGKAFHRRIREILSSYDKDVNPDPAIDEPAGGRVVVGAFSYLSSGGAEEGREKAAIGSYSKRGKSNGN